MKTLICFWTIFLLPTWIALVEWSGQPVPGAWLYVEFILVLAGCWLIILMTHSSIARKALALLGTAVGLVMQFVIVGFLLIMVDGLKGVMD